LYFSFFKNNKIQIKTTQNIRVLQLIDSLEIGGAEKMAVQLANALSSEIECSALCCTRNTGPLKNEMNDKVKFIELNKKYTLDVSALFRLRTFVNTHGIRIIHAHGTSFFFASLLKFVLPKLKLIWHDHYGLNRPKRKGIPEFILVFCSLFFDQIIVVKRELKAWALKHLKCKKVEMVNNFSTLSKTGFSNHHKRLKGDKNSKKIIHVANFRPQKDHLTGLKAIQLLKKENPNITYHLLGSFDKKDSYYNLIVDFINSNHLNGTVFIYGPKHDIAGYLQQADIGILTSKSEGLPLSVIEYALAKLPIVVSHAGACISLVEDHAKVFEPEDFKSLHILLKETISNPETARSNSEKLYKKVNDSYSQDKILKQILSIYEGL